MSTDVYVKLAEHVNTAPVGAPMSKNLIEILKILFTPEEAELARKIPFLNTDLPTLMEQTGMDEERLKEILVGMAKKGTVFMNEKGKFRLLPSMVGFFETSFWRGRLTEDANRTARLWATYFTEEYGPEVAGRQTPLTRVVPVEESIEPGAAVTPPEMLDELMNQVDYFAVAHCPCRLMARRIDREHCDHDTENCFHFGSTAKYFVTQGMARELTRDETKRLLAKAHNDGLVHMADNHTGKIATLCSCCSDCCVWMRAKKELGLHNSHVNSNFIMEVSIDDCSGCGVCVDRCPVDAIAIDDNNIAAVDDTRCIGCGVCHPTCSTKAVRLVPRAHAYEIPPVGEFIQRLMSEKGL
jgi:Pyruvate/2-oxoacid:ferredoxin oxidoreductase delta subunit